MNFDDYRLRDRAKYAAFVDRILQILAAAIKAQGMSPHAITGRAKDSDSLEKKLQDRSIDPASAIEEQIKDLAGARVIFLTNAQVQRFLGAGVIHDNFEVSSVNVHHSVPGTENETRLFSSTNYFVKLKEARLSLSEYAPFAGLRAEIQVQTLLNHAWAEMNHDTFYKEPTFCHVDRAQFEQIKGRMDAVMREHLLPAGHDFDKISRDMALLIKAEDEFGPAVEAIKTSQSNNELSSAIEILDEVVMQRLTGQRERFLALLPDLVDAVNRSRGTPPDKIETVLGSVDGESGEDVARKFASLLHHHRYCDPAQTLKVLLELYRTSGSEEERALWLEQGTSFAEHDLQVWRTHGPANQKFIVDGIAALEPEAVKSLRGIVLGMLEKVLSSDVGGTSRGDELNTLVIHQGSVVPSEALMQVRADAISILERMLAVASDDSERAGSLRALREATRPPFHGGSAPLRTAVMNDAARVIAIERTLAPACGFELRRQMEIAALHVHYWYGILPPDMADDAELRAAHIHLLGEIIALRDQLNADRDFVIYKMLIGHDTVRPQAWTADPFDFQATEKWRLAGDLDVLALIDAEGTEAWTDRVRRYITEPIAPGEIAPMRAFSTRLASARPEVAIHLLDKMDNVLAPLSLSLINGLDQAGQTDIVRRFAVQWISEGRFLAELADWLGSQTTLDLVLLAAVNARGRELDDRAAVLSTVNAAARLWFENNDRRLIEDVFIPAVIHFTAVGEPGWIRQARQMRRKGIVAALDENQARLLLQSFANVTEIDYDADCVLSLVAELRPELIFDFFEARIGRDDDKNEPRYDPIPFRIHDLQKPLAQHPDLLLEAVRRWYTINPRLHQFRGGRMVGNVFPKLPDAVAVPLNEIVRNADRDDLAFVLATLQSFDGIEEIYPLCMDVVDRLEPDDDELLKRVSDVLGATGVVSGEFGYVDAESEQYVRLGRYLEDPRPNVKAYAESARRRATQSMAWEQRRAEQDFEQMRRDWS